MNTGDKAACRDTGVMMLFFGPDGERPAEREIRERKAKAICALCPLRAKCLEYALRHPAKYGIWGGLNGEGLAAERRRLLRRGALRTGSVSHGLSTLPADDETACDDEDSASVVGTAEEKPWMRPSSPAACS